MFKVRAKGAKLFPEKFCLKGQNLLLIAKAYFSTEHSNDKIRFS